MNTPCRAGHRWLAGLTAMTLAAVACPAALAGPLDKFTGYTRIGHPATPEKGGKERPVEVDDAKAIGVTIYFMVLDRKTGKLGVVGDSWGVGVPGIDDSFVSGRNNDREKLDLEARYLYLYQIVNDREGTKTAVKDVTVRVIVDPRLITSWGYFRLREKDKAQPVKGLGFAMEFPDTKEKEKDKFVTRPISTAFAGVREKEKRYENPARAHLAPNPYSLAFIPTGLVREVGDESEVGKAPEDVLLVPNADFGETGSDKSYLKPALGSDVDRLPSTDDLDARKRIREQYRNRWPAIRAYWRDTENQIKPRQRSTIFGFTSDLPPTLETVSVGGRGMGIGFGRLAPRGLIPEASLVSLDRRPEPRVTLTSRDREAIDAPEALVMAGPNDLRRILGQRGDNPGLALPPIAGTLPTPHHPAGPVAREKVPKRAPAERPKKGDETPAVAKGNTVEEAPGGGGGGTTPAAGVPQPGLLAASGRLPPQGFGMGGGGGGSGGGGSDGTRVTVGDRDFDVGPGGGPSPNAPPIDTNIVPAPAVWLLGVLGVPVLVYFARKGKGRPARP